MYLNSDIHNFNKNYLKSAMCFTKFYDLNLVQFASLAQVAYETNIATDKIKAYLMNGTFNGFNNIKISEIK